MADTRNDIMLVPRTWTNLYTAAGITAGSAVSIYNKGSSVALIAIKAGQPSNSGFGVPLYVGANGSYAFAPDGSSGLWGYSDQGTTILVQE